MHGIEITTGAANIADGKPVFLLMGAHHAREWPTGENAIEYAYDLLQNFRRPAGDPRAEPDRAGDPHHRRADHQPRRVRDLPQR